MRRRNINSWTCFSAPYSHLEIGWGWVHWIGQFGLFVSLSIQKLDSLGYQSVHQKLDSLGCLSVCPFTLWSAFLLSSTVLQLGMGVQPPQEENWWLGVSSGEILPKQSCWAAACINISTGRCSHEGNFAAWLFSSAAPEAQHRARGTTFGSPASWSFAPPGAVQARYFSSTHPGCFPRAGIQGRVVGTVSGVEDVPVWAVIGGECSLRDHWRAAGDFSALVLSRSFLECGLFSLLGLISWI